MATNNCCTNKITNPCPSYPDAHCVIYTGDNLVCIGAKTNDRLDIILGKIDAIICDVTSNVFVDDTNCINLSGTGSEADPIIATPNIANEIGNLISCTPTGLFVGAPDFDLFARNGTNIDEGWIELGGLLLHDTTVDFSDFNLAFANVETDLTATRVLALDGDDNIVITAGAAFTSDNGLTNSTPTNVQWGGTLLHNTSIIQATFDVSYTGGNVGFRVADPAHTIAIGDDQDSGVERSYLHASSGQQSEWQAVGNGHALCVLARSSIQLAPNIPIGAGDIKIQPGGTGNAYVDIIWRPQGVGDIGVIGLDLYEPGVSNQFYIKSNDTPPGPNFRSTYTVIYDKLKLANIPQNDVAPKVIAIDAQDNVRYIDASVLGGGSATSINQASFNGDGVTTSFLIAHGLVGTPKFHVTAASVDAGGWLYATADATNITVFYAVSPDVGVANVLLNWSANL